MAKYRRYIRVSLGKGAKFAALGFSEGWIGTGWLESVDLTGNFHENWRDFNKEYIPLVMSEDGIATKVGAGLACGMTHTVASGLKAGDIVISSKGNGSFQMGEVTGDYFYAQGQPLPHRRSVKWFETTFSRDQVSDEFRRSLGSANTVSDITGYGEEIDRFLHGLPGEVIVNDEDVESPLSFVLEQHLEDFLVSNWEHTDLGKKYDIFTIDGEQVGQQFETDTGPIDILAVSKDGKELLVVELKRGRVSDRVVGQILRYMGYVSELDESKTVKGIIIGTDDDQRFRRALSMTPSIEFYKYEVSFKLTKA